MASEKDLYQPSRVKALFDEMYQRYGVVNLIASFGFTAIWRKVCVDKIKRQDADLVLDLMTGMGETLPDIEDHFRQLGKIQGIDFSHQMCIRARKNLENLNVAAEIIEADVFEVDILPGSADVIVSTFGLKTFSPQQQRELAKQVDRLLKPNGEFSFVEVSVPKSPLLKLLYGFYMNHVIPNIGKICMGNPDNYRYLGIYTREYGNSQNFQKELVKRGLNATYFEHFFGCASGVYGNKPKN
ncbi:MAG: class I SAM-dependent methyltransferase [Bdellovibrionaceae bacterium]|nr:class I SAM-dependent methyltransferase [Pseudobdellovibrionaceae bacterium]